MDVAQITFRTWRVLSEQSATQAKPLTTRISSVDDEMELTELVSLSCRFSVPNVWESQNFSL
jgi:hypothetical protein